MCDGDGTITSESTLTYNSEILSIGADDEGVAEIIRTPHSDGAGGELRIKGGSATAGQTDQAGSKLRLFGGQGTGTGVGGHVEIKTAPAAGSTGTTLNALSHTWEFADDGSTTIPGTLTTGSTAAMTNAGQLSVAAQPNITTLGTLTNLNVDNININTSTIATGGGNDMTIQASGDINLTALGNDINVDTDNFTITSATTVKPNFVLNTTIDSNKPANMKFVKARDSANGADGDFIGEIYYNAGNDAQEQTTFASTQGIVRLAADGAEEGQYQIKVKNTSSTTAQNGVLIASNGAVNDVTLGHGAASTTTIAGDLTVTTGLILDSVDVTTIQTSAESFADNDTSLMTSAAIDDRINAASADEVVSAGDHILKQTKVTIDTAGFNGLNSTPVELVAAQGANKVIVPTEVVLFHDRASNQTNSVDLIVGFNGLTSYPTAVKYIRRYMQNITTDRTMTMGDYSRNYANDLTTAVNSNLTIATSGAPTTNCVTSLTVYTSYYVIDIS